MDEIDILRSELEQVVRELIDVEEAGVNPKMAMLKLRKTIYDLDLARGCSDVEN